MDFHKIIDMSLSALRQLGSVLQNSKALSTFVLVCVLLLVRGLIVLWLQNHTEQTHHEILRWRQRIRYVSLIFLVMALLVIWAPELRTFAVSIVAVAAAVVVAVKELLTCLSGAIIRTTVEGARIGGRISVNGVRGDVVSLDILSTTLLEVNDNGQRTGKNIVVPNSMFLNMPATTESVDNSKFVLMQIGIPLRLQDDWRALEKALLQAGNTKSEPYMKEAKKHFGRFNRTYGFNAPGPEPKVLIDWESPEHIVLNLRMAAPVTEQNLMRQEVLRAVLQAVQDQAIQAGLPPLTPPIVPPTTTS